MYDPAMVSVTISDSKGNSHILKGFTTIDEFFHPTKYVFKNVFEHTRKPFEFMIHESVDKSHFLNFLETMYGCVVLDRSKAYPSYFRVNIAFTEEECRKLANFIDTM